MKSIAELLDQYLKIKQRCIDECWDGCDYTGRGEKRLMRVDEIKERYTQNIIDHLGGLNEKTVHTPVLREVYMMRILNKAAE